MDDLARQQSPHNKEAVAKVTELSKKVIEMLGVQKAYPSPLGPITVLKAIDLIIRQGEFVAIMGPSGSGKSTMMNILGCLDRFGEGSYKLDGREVANLEDRELAALRCDVIGFVFQGFNLMQRLNLLNNVALPMVYAKKPTAFRQKRATELLKRVGLEKFLSYKPNSISGGQQQRVTIARALSNNPSLILADEPTGNLDTKTSHEVMNLFTEINREGNTIVVVTHEPDVAAYAHRVVRLLDGVIVYDGPIEGDSSLAAAIKTHAEQGLHN